MASELFVDNIYPGTSTSITIPSGYSLNLGSNVNLASSGISTSNGFIVSVAGNEDFIVDAAGTVTMPYQPIFYAYQSAALFGTALGAFTNQFNTTLVNVGSHYNTSTGRFTVPVAGTYRFDAKFLARQGANSGALEFTFYKNGSNVVGRSFCYTTVSASGDHDTMFATAYLTLAVNDYIQVGFTAVSSGTDYYYGQNLASFSGQLIG